MMNPHSRFVVVKHDWRPASYVLLGDWQFWADHEEELDAWCRDNGARRQGMTLEMTEDVLAMFVLRWS
jgi:hypothetical protein